MKRRWQLMMFFSIGIGLESVGVVGADLACWQVGLQAPGSSGLRLDRYNAELQAPNAVFLYKNKKEGGSARALPVVAPMPKSVSL